MKRFVGVLAVLLVCGCGPEDDALGEAPQSLVAGYRAFSTASYWNTPLPANAPLHPDSGALIARLKSNSSPGYPHLVTGSFAQPVFWTGSGDPVVKVTGTNIRPELQAGVRIPTNAKPAASSDAEVAVWDLQAGYVWNIWHAVKHADGSWSAGGSDLWYLGSNGLDGRLAESNERRNGGHRGYPQGALGYVRVDEVVAGHIDHVLKMALNDTGPCHIFPGVGDEHGIGKICEGARLRIKPSVDLGQRNLSAAARVIARALQTYGAVVGDQSGGQFNLKLEDPVIEGRGDLWKGVLTASSLSAISIDDFEVIAYGYGS